MLLVQAEPSIRETFETSSSGVSLTLYEKPWDQFEERTEGVSDFEEVDDVFPFSKERFILNEEDSTRAEERGFSQWLQFYTTRAEGRALSLREQLCKRWQQDNYSYLLGTFREKLHRIAEREDGWDGKGSKKPGPFVLNTAYITLEKLFDTVVNSGRRWSPPFVSSDEDGHITMQWNHGVHELHIEINEEEIEYTKVWGVNIEHEMILGVLKEKDFRNLWDWLNE